MIRDRMPDLLANYRSSSSTFSTRFLRDVHLQIGQNEKEFKQLEKLLDEAEDIRTLIQNIVENVSIVKNLHNNILSYMNKDLQKELETRTYAISQTAFRVQQKLRDLRKGINVNNLTIDDLTIVMQDKPIYTKIRMLQYATMSQMFSEIMEDYNASSIKYYDKCQSLLERQCSLTSMEPNMIDTSEDATLFVNNILLDTKRVRLMLSDTESRHNEILKLEQSLTEIKDMFMKIALLIQEQGERINTIEYLSTKTERNVGDAYIDLEKWKERMIKNKKCKCRILVITSVIVVIFLLFQIIIAS